MNFWLFFTVEKCDIIGKFSFKGDFCWGWSSQIILMFLACPEQEEAKRKCVKDVSYEILWMYHFCMKC